MAYCLDALRDRVADVAKRLERFFDRPNVHDADRDDFHADSVGFQILGDFVPQGAFNDLAVGRENQVDEVLAHDIDHMSPRDHRGQSYGIGRYVQEVLQVADRVLQHHVDLEQGRIAGEDGEVGGLVVPARYAVGSDSLDRSDVDFVNDRNVVMDAGLGMLLDHFPESHDDAGFLFLDYVESAGEDRQDDGGNNEIENAAPVQRDVVERRVDDPRAGRQGLAAHLIHLAGISWLSKYLNSSLSAGSSSVVFLSMIES